MNAAIYYFSATGNSLVVARDLAAALNANRIIPITKAIKDNSAQPYDIIGIVYPVYMFGLPLIVRDFLNKVWLNPKTYIFSAATLGGLPGRAHTMTKVILEKRGLRLSCAFSVRMPGNYTPLYGAIPKEKQEEEFRQEKEKIKEIAEAVLQRNTGIIEESPFLPNWLLHVLLYRGGTAMIPLSGKNFWITEACNKCGICAKVCPAENINLVEGKPRWLDHCQHCMACLQWCPIEAIQYKKSTVGRKRYHHPQVSALDIMEQR